MKKIIGCCLVICFILLQSQFQIINLSMYEKKQFTVEIKGLIKQPGVYSFERGDNVESLILKAGGINEGGDLSSINLGKQLMDGDVIVIKEAKASCVSLNQGSIEELMTLSGIGEAKAKAILEYRLAYGFKSIEEVMLVKGIGEKLFAKFQEQLCL